MSDRFSFPRSELRRRTLRGVVVTGGFLVVIDGLALAQGLVVTRLLGPAEIGLYGIVSTFVVSIVALKRVGIDEAFVAQEEPDQEAEFQRAFTLELALGAAFTALICALAPAVAAASVSITAITSPLVTLSPSFFTIFTSTPSVGAGSSSTTLSVSRSTRFSSRTTASPGFLCHETSVASATDSGSCGTRTSIVMIQS